MFPLFLSVLTPDNIEIFNGLYRAMQDPVSSPLEGQRAQHFTYTLHPPTGKKLNVLIGLNGFIQVVYRFLIGCLNSVSLPQNYLYKHLLKSKNNSKHIPNTSKTNVQTYLQNRPKAAQNIPEKQNTLRGKPVLEMFFFSTNWTVVVVKCV